MRILITIFLLAHFACAFSQVTGTRFAPDSTYSRASGGYVSAMPGSSTWHYFNENDYFLGDTVINNKYYQCVYTTTLPNFDTVCLGAKHLVYYDSNQVFLDNVLIYDFNLIIGDSARVLFSRYDPYYPVGYYYFPVTQVDSVYIGNIWRKRITIYKPNIFATNWVEGIGDINYGFNVNYASVYLIFAANGYYHLNCFSEHFQSTYGTGCTAVGSVCTLVGIEESMVTQDLINIYPNPASQELSIEVPTEIKLKQIKAIDITGKEYPLSYSAEGDSYKMNLTNFTAGLYFIEFITEKGVVRKKVIVE